MDSVLTHTHIRGVISLQDPPFILPETALYIYFLAQEQVLHRGASVHAKQLVALNDHQGINAMEGKVDFMPGAYRSELWEDYERVRMDLASNLLKFRNSGAQDIMKDLHCGNPPSISPILKWLNDYIEPLVRYLLFAAGYHL